MRINASAPVPEPAVWLVVQSREHVTAAQLDSKLARTGAGCAATAVGPGRQRTDRRASMQSCQIARITILRTCRCATRHAATSTTGMKCSSLHAAKQWHTWRCLTWPVAVRKTQGVNTCSCSRSYLTHLALLDLASGGEVDAEHEERHQEQCACEGEKLHNVDAHCHRCRREHNEVDGCTPALVYQARCVASPDAWMHVEAAARETSAGRLHVADGRVSHHCAGSAAERYMKGMRGVDTHRADIRPDQATHPQGGLRPAGSHPAGLGPQWWPRAARRRA